MGNKPTDVSEYRRDLIKHKARQLVGHFGLTVSDIEDIEQDVQLHVVERMDRFDPQRGCERTFVARVVSHKIISIIRHRCAAQRHWASVEKSLDSPDDDVSHAAVDGHAAIEELADLTIDVQDACAALDEDQKRLIELLRTDSLAEAARKLGLTRGAARGCVNQIGRQWRIMGMDIYVEE